MVTLPKTEKYMKDNNITIHTIICIENNMNIHKRENSFNCIILVRTTLTTIKNSFKEKNLTKEKLIKFLDDFFLCCLKKKDLNKLRNPFSKFALQTLLKGENIIILPYYTGFSNNDLYTLFAYDKI